MGRMDKLCSYGLDGELQIKLVRCWPGLRKCLTWPFPSKPLVVGKLESILCPQTLMCFAGHQMPPFAQCLLVWPGGVLCQARCQALGSPSSQLWTPAWPCVQGSLHAIWQLGNKWKYTDWQCGQLASSSS